MKRIKAIFFLLCFLIAHSGISIFTHWCGKVLTHISLYEHDSDPCECGKVKKEMSGCCKDKTATLHAKSDLSVESIAAYKVPDVECFFTFYIEGHKKNLFASLHTTRFPDNLPPYRPKVPLYLLDGVFLI